MRTLIQDLTGATSLGLRPETFTDAVSVVVQNLTAINAGFEFATTQRMGTEEESKECQDNFLAQNRHCRNAESQLDIGRAVIAFIWTSFIGACAEPQTDVTELNYMIFNNFSEMQFFAFRVSFLKVRQKLKTITITDVLGMCISTLAGRSRFLFGFFLVNKNHYNHPMHHLYIYLLSLAEALLELF